VGLAAQWERIVASLPEGWVQAELRLLVPAPANRSRALALLTPLAPGRVGSEIHFHVSRQTGVGAEPTRRLLAKLDEEEISGTLVLTSSPAHPRGVTPLERERPPLVAQWDALVAELPPDWSDLLCRLDLPSSDALPRAALLAAPLNPSRPAGEVGFDFRAARESGYGTSAQMVRRCLGRLDDEGIHGRVEVLRALSDTRHVSTQGPVWYVGGKVL
jgi:hypothetical protein